MNLSEMKIYRMTHIQNIPHIIEYGITHRNSSNADPNYVQIGDNKLINTRNSYQVQITNGNRTIARGVFITLGDYIPFYFGVRMPMLYVVKNGGNFVLNPTSPENIVYLVCKISDIISSGMTFYFSDGHPTDFFTQFYDQTQINRLVNIIDWQAICSKYWGGENNLDIKRKKQAEFLVGSDIPATFLTYFGCYNNVAKNCLLSFGIPEEKIIIVPNAYY